MEKPIKKSDKKYKDYSDNFKTDATMTKSAMKQLIKGLKIDITLAEEQKRVVEKFYNYDFNFVIGDMASGKTFISVYTALNHLMKGKCEQIWIARPMLKNNLGALPGMLEEKLYPYIFPIIQNIEMCIGKEKTEKLMENGVINIIPVEIAKGVTFMNSAVIFDEFQECDYDDLRTMLSRLGDGSKMLLCGSKQQISKLIGKDSCIHRIGILEDSDLVGYSTLTSNHRSKSLTKLLPILDKSNEDTLKQQKSEWLRKSQQSTLLKD